MTTTNAIDRVIARPTVAAPAAISQATAVEQSRAIAEVQAAVYVAQMNPRDLERAVAEMRDACSRTALAQVAFYTVPNRGHDKSVHLARELVRIWGNTDYGVRELHRDDAAGHSEVLAYAWDQQTNSRASRSFINPHARMKGRERQQLTDLHDIYLSNQNIGARAVRECIFQILPKWFVEEAADHCRATLERGDGKPLADRIREMVAAFDKLGVSVQRIETKIGRKRGQWTGADLADAAVAYTSITRDGISADELFPPQRVTADEIAKTTRPAERQEPVRVDGARTGAGEGDPANAPLPDARSRAMFATFRDAAKYEPSLDGKDGQLDFIAEVIGRRVESRKDMTVAEGEQVIERLLAFIAQQEPPAGGES